MTLYLGDGVSCFMSIDGMYLACDFSRLSKNGLHYFHVHELIQAVVNSGIFTIAKSENPYGISWFASPLYLNEKELEKAMEEHKNRASTDTANPDEDMIGDWYGHFSSVQRSGTEIVHSNSIINNTGINNIILSGRKTASPKSDGESQSQDVDTTQRSPITPRSFSESVAGRTIMEGQGGGFPPYEVRNTEVDRFIHEMYTDKEFFFPLREILMAPEYEGRKRPESEVFAQDQAREILNRIMYHHVKPYFMEQLRFFKYPGIEGRREWLRNLLYGKNGRKLITAATNYCRQKWKREQQQAFNAQCQAIHNNHPLSPHEWTAPATGRRYYDEAPNIVIPIPDDAPPRPSEDSRWNKFTGQWI